MYTIIIITFTTFLIIIMFFLASPNESMEGKIENIKASLVEEGILEEEKENPYLKK